jgi:hypothetical protein
VNVDPANPVVALCAAGMAIEGGYRSFIALGVARLEDRLAGNNAGS